MMRARTIVRFAIAACALALGAAAQLPAQRQAAPPKKPPKAGQTIVIHGQVPTPQVVTVRPREVPVYDRQVLGAENGSTSFWPAAMPGYRLLSRSEVTGKSPTDSAAPSVAAGGAAPGAAGAAPNAAAAQSTDLTARTREMEAIRSELAQRRARLDSLERADREAAAKQHAADSASSAAAQSSQNVANAAQRAAEIKELMKELEYRRARLDSLEAVVKALGVARDSLRAPHDTTQLKR